MAIRQLDNGTIVSRIKQTPDILPVRLGEDDKRLMALCGQVLEQPKDSTLLKQMARIGAKVILDDLTGEILAEVFENKRKNKRTGFDAEYI